MYTMQPRARLPMFQSDGGLDPCRFRGQRCTGARRLYLERAGSLQDDEESFFARDAPCRTPGEVLEIQVGVDLGGADIGVSEQLLHGAQVTAGFQQVAGKGMAQGMGVDSPGSPPLGPAVHALLDGAPPDARPERPVKTAVSPSARQLGTQSQPGPQRLPEPCGQSAPGGSCCPCRLPAAHLPPGPYPGCRGTPVRSVAGPMNTSAPAWPGLAHPADRLAVSRTASAKSRRHSGYSGQALGALGAPDILRGIA